MESKPNKLYNRTEWYNEDGLLHRENDLPAIEWNDGTQFAWYLNGKFHRIGGPSFWVKDGYAAYRQYGNYHRIDGPAIINYSTGATQWWVNNVRIDTDDDYFCNYLRKLIYDMLAWMFYISWKLPYPEKTELQEKLYYLSQCARRLGVVLTPIDQLGVVRSDRSARG